MAKIIMSLPFLCLFILFLNSGGILKLANGEDTGALKASWCVAKPSTPDAELQANIDFCCNSLSSCDIIQANGACFYPIELVNHASVVMNLYYQKSGKHFWDCNFNNSGVVTTTDPSYGSCKYEYTS